MRDWHFIIVSDFKHSKYLAWFLLLLTETGQASQCKHMQQTGGRNRLLCSSLSNQITV